MAYTIIEVERLTQISSHTLRFWAKKGLFPFVKYDKNNVKLFSQKDVEWAIWIECLRSMDMSLEDIRHYIELCQKGLESAEERRGMLTNQKTIVRDKIAKMQKSLNKLESKIEMYNEMIRTGKDFLNPQSQEYKKSKEYKR